MRKALIIAAALTLAAPLTYALAAAPAKHNALGVTIGDPPTAAPSQASEKIALLRRKPGSSSSSTSGRKTKRARK